MSEHLRIKLYIAPLQCGYWWNVSALGQGATVADLLEAVHERHEIPHYGEYGLELDGFRLKDDDLISSILRENDIVRMIALLNTRPAKRRRVATDLSLSHNVGSSSENGFLEAPSFHDGTQGVQNTEPEAQPEVPPQTPPPTNANSRNGIEESKLKRATAGEGKSSTKKRNERRKLQRRLKHEIECGHLQKGAKIEDMLANEQNIAEQERVAKQGIDPNTLVVPGDPWATLTRKSNANTVQRASPKLGEERRNGRQRTESMQIPVSSDNAPKPFHTESGASHIFFDTSSLPVQPSSTVTTSDTASSEITDSQPESEEEAWKDRMILNAVECEDDTYDVDVPSYPFSQHYPPQNPQEIGSSSSDDRPGAADQLPTVSDEQHELLAKPTRPLLPGCILSYRILELDMFFEPRISSLKIAKVIACSGEPPDENYELMVSHKGQNRNHRRLRKRNQDFDEEALESQFPIVTFDTLIDPRVVAEHE